MNAAQILPGQSVRNLIIAPQTLSPKNGGNIVDKLLNKCARQRQQWAGGKCSNNRQLTNS